MKLKKWLITYKRPLFFVGIFAIFFIVSATKVDPDFGWHLRSGAYFVEHGIPATDIFTYTASQFPWVNHEWLSDILLNFLYNVGSYWLLAVIYAALWTTSVILFSRRTPLPYVFIAVIGLLPFAGVRALTWSVFFLALLVTILAAKNARWRATIPFLFLVWANFHGSFLLGFLYGGWVLLKERSWKLLVIGLVSFALTFCNPYGYHIYTEIFRTMLDSDLSETVVEWMRFSFPLAAVTYTLVWLGILVAAIGKRWKEYLRLDVFFFVWAALSSRMLPLFTLVSLYFLPDLIDTIKAKLPKEAIPRFVKMTRLGTIIVVIVATLAFVGGHLFSLQKGFSYPQNAVAYLERTPCRGNLFNEYNFGGYLISVLPSHKVYIDGRMPSWEFEGRDYMATYMKVSSGDPVWRQEFSDFSISCAITFKYSKLTEALKSDGWQVVAEDPSSYLLIRP